MMTSSQHVSWRAWSRRLMRRMSATLVLIAALVLNPGLLTGCYCLGPHGWRLGERVPESNEPCAPQLSEEALREILLGLPTHHEIPYEGGVLTLDMTWQAITSPARPALREQSTLELVAPSHAYIIRQHCYDSTRGTSLWVEPVMTLTWMPGEGTTQVLARDVMLGRFEFNGVVNGTITAPVEDYRFSSQQELPLWQAQIMMHSSRSYAITLIGFHDDRLTERPGSTWCDDRWLVIAWGHVLCFLPSHAPARHDSEGTPLEEAAP